MLAGFSFALLACRVSGDDLSPTARLPPVALDTPAPPPADSAQQERLYQLLYAGEIGEQAHAAGQRVRVRAWLVSMGLSPAQTEGLKALLTLTRTLDAELRAEREAADVKEQAALLPIYADLEARLSAAPTPTEPELEAFATRLTAARLSTQTDPTWAESRRVRVRKMLDGAGVWLGTLQRRQQERLAESRFFLARRTNPLGNVGDDEALVGVAWDGGDFSALDTTGTAPEQPQMDIGGLWAIEKMRAPPGQYLPARKLQAIVVMALQEPALAEALGIP